MLAFLNLGGTELVLILVLVLLLFGADRLPAIARSLGRARSDMERARREVTAAFESEDDRQLSEQLMFERAREEHMRIQNAEFEALRKAANDLGIDTTSMVSQAELQAAIRERVAGKADS